MKPINTNEAYREWNDNQSIERAELESRDMADLSAGQMETAVLISRMQHRIDQLEAENARVHDVGWHSGWAAAINAAIAKVEQCDPYEARPKCESCGGLGTPSGEAAGLVCGACNGTGIESEEEID